MSPTIYVSVILVGDAYFALISANEKRQLLSNEREIFVVEGKSIDEACEKARVEAERRHIGHVNNLE